MFARVHGAIEHGVVAEANLVSLLEHTHHAEGVAAAHIAAQGEPDGVLGIGRPAQAEQAAPQEQVRKRAEGYSGARGRKAAEFVVRQPDPMAGNELRPQESVLGVDVGVVVAIGEVNARSAQFRRVLRDVGVDPAVLVRLLQTMATLHHRARATHRKTRRDGVQIAAFTVIAIDQFLRFLFEVFGRDADLRRSETVDAGKAGDHAQVAPGGLVEEFLSRDRAAGRERQTGGGTAGEESVEEIFGGGAGVVTIAVLQLFGENPGGEPIEELSAISAEDAHLRKVDMSIDESGQDEPVLQVRNLQAGVAFGDIREGSEVGDDAVFNDEKPVTDKAGGFRLFPNMFPRIVDEIEKSPSNCATRTGHGFPLDEMNIGV